MMTLYVIGVVLGIVFSALFSGAETGLYCVNRVRLELDVRAGNRAARRVQEVLQNESHALSMTLVGTNVSNYLATTLAAVIIAHVLQPSPSQLELFTTLIVTPVLFVFAEVVPKNLFQANADLLLRWVGSVLLVFHRMLRYTGVLSVIGAVSVRLTRLVAGSDGDVPVDAPKYRVATMIREALLNRAPETELTDVVDRVISLSDTPVHRVMVRRNKVIAIDRSATRAELTRIARSTPHTRLPIYDGRPDQIVGVIKIDELLKTDDWERVGDKVRDVLRLPADTPVASAISRARQARHFMVIVVNRHGRAVGIATLKDLLEEIVGELSDW